jgi:hypothetical protein
MRYVRWVVLLGVVRLAFACTPFVGRRPDGGADSAEAGADVAGDQDGGARTAVPDSANGEGPMHDRMDASMPLRANGAGCFIAEQCLSSHCIDGVCCASSSCDQCQACNLNQAGTCSPKARGAADPACPNSASSCNAGGCDGFGKCLPAPLGTPCDSNVCSNGMAAGGQWAFPVAFSRTCDGISASILSCQDTPHETCGGNLACAADRSRCLSSCSLDTDCIHGTFCSAGVCIPLIPVGSSTACTTNHQCASDVCYRGRCVECVSYLDCKTDSLDCEFATHTCTCNDPNGCTETRSCAGQYECPLSRAPFCLSGKCACGSFGACKPPYVCLASDTAGTGARCSLPVGSPCLSDSDCAPNQCLGGVCAFQKDPLCARDADCVVGACKGGHCRMFCSLANDCPVGSACVDQHCTNGMLVACAHDEDCPATEPKCCAGYSWVAPRCSLGCD